MAESRIERAAEDHLGPNLFAGRPLYIKMLVTFGEKLIREAAEIAEERGGCCMNARTILERFGLEPADE